MELLSVTMTEGVKKRSELDGKDNSSEDKSNYKLVRAGDMVYNSMRMWQGASGISTIDGIVSPAYTVLTSRHAIANGFFAALFKSHNTIGKFRRYSQGMTSDTWNLKYPQLAPIRISIPSLDEQKKIATFLEIFDKRIMKQKQYVEYLKSYKRGVSNAIFAHSVGFHHEGESETSTWRVMPFGEVFDFLNSNTLSRADLNYSSGEVKNIHYGDILTKYGAIIDPCSSTVPYINTDAPLSYHKLDYLKTGDIVIADTAEDLTAGKVTEIACANEAKCVSGLHTVACRPRQRFASGYLGHYLNSDYYHRQLLPLIQGTKVSSIARSALVGTHIAFPCLSEQIKVSKCLSLIDTRVEIEERNLDRLVECRKSLLQKLFV